MLAKSFISLTPSRISCIIITPLQSYSYLKHNPFPYYTP
nr:MAG TPA: hypothetical protein [Bacteriophage sp.]